MPFCATDVLSVVRVAGLGCRSVAPLRSAQSRRDDVSRRGACVRSRNHESLSKPSGAVTAPQPHRGQSREAHGPVEETAQGGRSVKPASMLTLSKTPLVRCGVRQCSGVCESRGDRPGSDPFLIVFMVSVDVKQH